MPTRPLAATSTDSTIPSGAIPPSTSPSRLSSKNMPPNEPMPLHQNEASPVWADGIYLQTRLEDAKQCILVVIGATPEGRKELLGFTDGARESAQDWRELLLDLQNRGLVIAPELAIADGARGFWKALGELW